MRFKVRLGVAAAILLLAWAVPALADREENIFYNNFDNVAAGTLPSPWQVVYSGKGMAFQTVSRDRAFSGRQSLKLLGVEGFSSVVQRPFATEAPVIATSYRMLISSYGKPYMDTPGLFSQRAETYWGTWYGAVVFDHQTRKILNDRNKQPIVEGDWVPDTWYQVRVLVDRVDMRVRIWIDGALKVDESWQAERFHPEWINSLGLVAGHAGVPVYYDNVRVFLPGIRETSRLLLDEIDLLVSRSELSAALANQLRAHIINAMENEEGGDLPAAISDLNNFRNTVLAWGRPGAPPQIDNPPVLMLKSCNHMTKVADQMIRQLTKRLR